MSDEPWGTYGAYQSAARAVLGALVRLLREAELDGMEANAGWDCWMANARAAIAAAKAAGVDATEEQGERERSDRSELPSTGGRTDLLPCPFCDQPLFRGRGKINPYAVCRTEDCFGAKVAAVSLDDPGDVAAYNRRALLSSDTGGRTEEVMAVLRQTRNELYWCAEQLKVRGLPGVPGDSVDRALAASAALLSPSLGEKE